uniref:EF-hand domain-containing protein n=1 Tax=Caenorhabditis japonica TaxID=281687 RepID=A0A8R1DWV5_CAEJA
MTEGVQMKNVPELKFPTVHWFSPLATSSPKLTKMRAAKRIHSPGQSWTSSDSSGNVTSQLIDGFDELLIDTSKRNQDSTVSMYTAVEDESTLDRSISLTMRTALEYVDPEMLRHEPVKLMTREELRSAILDRMQLNSPSISDEDFNIYATVITERIFWKACRTWTGTIPINTVKDITDSADFACKDWYMSNTALFCADELQSISELNRFDWNCVATYCHGKGMPIVVIKRIFTDNLVRRSTGECLDIVEMIWLLFAMFGTDEPQSFEYWFRVLDVQSTGILAESDLNKFYSGISHFLAERNVTSLPFENVMTQFNDILGTSDWTLRVFKKNPHLTGRVINGFVNAYRFLDQETDEKTNAERMDDEDFGRGSRTRWERMIDHEFDEFYSSSSESSS